jgi:hypothetical protein
VKPRGKPFVFLNEAGRRVELETFKTFPKLWNLPSPISSVPQKTMMNSSAAAAATRTAADASNSNSNNNDPLSRASLYAPLSNYNDNPEDEDDDVGKQQASKRPRRTPKSLTESSLIQFLQGISVDYHRNNNNSNNNNNNATVVETMMNASSYHYGYNSGIRPLGDRDVTEAIQGRALLLVGGRRHYNHGMIHKPAATTTTTTILSSMNKIGIPGLSTAEISNNTNTKTKQKQETVQILPVLSGANSMSQKRRRQRPRGVNTPNGKCSIPFVFSNEQQQQKEDEQQQIDFLMQLNHLWNEYACTILLQLLLPDSRRDDGRAPNATKKTARNRAAAKGPQQQQQPRQGQQQQEPFDILAPENQALLIEFCRNPESILHAYWRSSTAGSGETATSAGMEWVGAMVRIEQCLQHANWTGLSGILVAVTANTWQVVQIEMLEDIVGTTGQNNERKVAKKMYDDEHDDDCKNKREAKKSDYPQEDMLQQEPDRSSSPPKWTLKRRLIVPKRGSSLSVLLPVPPTMDSEERNEKKECAGFGSPPSDNAASQTLRITLHGSQNVNI